MSEIQTMMNDIVQKVEYIMAIIDKFETNREGSIAITRLEEAVLWLNVMMNSRELKPKESSEQEIVN